MPLIDVRPITSLYESFTGQSHWSARVLALHAQTQWTACLFARARAYGHMRGFVVLLFVLLSCLVRPSLADRLNRQRNA